MSGITEIGAIFYLVLLLGGAASQSEQKNAQIQFGSGSKIERYAESSKQSQIEEHEDLHLEVEPRWKSGHYAEIPNQYSITEGKASSGSTNFSVVAELERPPADERVSSIQRYTLCLYVYKGHYLGF